MANRPTATPYQKKLRRVFHAARDVSAMKGGGPARYLEVLEELRAVHHPLEGLELHDVEKLYRSSRPGFNTLVFHNKAPSQMRAEFKRLMARQRKASDSAKGLWEGRSEKERAAVADAISDGYANRSAERKASDHEHRSAALQRRWESMSMAAKQRLLKKRGRTYAKRWKKKPAAERSAKMAELRRGYDEWMEGLSEEQLGQWRDALSRGGKRRWSKARAAIGDLFESVKPGYAYEKTGEGDRRIPMPAHMRTAVVEAMEADKIRAVRDAMRSLDPNERAMVFIVQFKFGGSARRAAEELGFSRSYVEGLYQRGLQKMREDPNIQSLKDNV